MGIGARRSIAHAIFRGRPKSGCFGAGMTSRLDQQLSTEMKGDRMPGWNGRQGGRSALLWCGPLVLGSVLCGQANAADAPASPDGALIVLPHVIRDPQFAEVILPAPAAATDSNWKQADASTRASRGRV